MHKQIKLLREEPFVGTNNSAHCDIWELRTKVNEIIKMVNWLKAKIDEVDERTFGLCRGDIKTKYTVKKRK